MVTAGGGREQSADGLIVAGHIRHVGLRACFCIGLRHRREHRLLLDGIEFGAVCDRGGAESGDPEHVDALH
jgi:hypothetical protein